MTAVREKKPFFIRYTFKFEDGTQKVFEACLDSKTLRVGTTPGPAPDWARLEYSQCEGCSLEPAKHPCCPVAVNFAEIVDAFKNIVSIRMADIIVEMEERTISKKTAVQNGLSSLMGIYMVASGCPIMEKLKPMVRTHLPFATSEETIYRTMTMYLGAQYFRMKKGLSQDWELSQLYRLYEMVRNVNIGFAERLQKASREDSIRNSISHLDVYAVLLNVGALKKVDSLEYLFAPYLESAGEIQPGDKKDAV
ncbi:MAG TPA: hypothetical protein DCL44_06310 [Elusimicrobia bacterium]|nr:hypothetical protein [Elusimicrobiota bacterium]